MTSPAPAAPHRPEKSPSAARGVERLNLVEQAQLARLRLWGTVGALLMMVGSTASYGAAVPSPNPVDGARILGLLSRLGPASLALSYTGAGLLVLCWFLIGRFSRPGRVRRLTRSQLSHTLAMWAVPLLITPPIFSRDSYSYLAIGWMMNEGFDPYTLGPYDALGPEDPLAHQVDGRWQHTGTPYGPVFLLISKGIVAITGQNVMAGILLQRLVEVLGVLLIVWALPRLARRCGVDPVSALWMGALNPLVLFHLIAGAHNEGLMIGFMMAGLVVALGRLHPEEDPAWLERQAWLRPIAGIALITVGVGVKATAGMALAFLVVALARRSGGRWSDLIRWGLLTAVASLAVFGLFTWWAGGGLGWIAGLGNPGSVQSFLSVSTTIGAGAGALGVLLGLGDHTATTVEIMQLVGTGLGGLLALVVLWCCWRPGRPRADGTRRPLVEPMLGLGLGLGVFVLLSPVIQPWYLLWAAIPLAATARTPGIRRATVWLCTIFAVIIMPNGATIPVFTIVRSVIAAAVVVALVLFLLARSGLPASRPPGSTEPDTDSDPAAADRAARPGGADAYPGSS